MKKMVMQLGAGDPMDMPVELSGSKPFTKPNPKTLVGTETIKVAAGSFKTKHYRDKTPQGDKIDFWVSESAPPLGLVKIELEQKNNPQIKGKLQFDLTGTGKDAKPLVTKPAKPFDQAALMQQMMGASGAGAGAGAPPGNASRPHRRRRHRRRLRRRSSGALGDAIAWPPNEPRSRRRSASRRPGVGVRSRSAATPPPPRR